MNDNEIELIKEKYKDLIDKAINRNIKRRKRS